MWYVVQVMSGEEFHCLALCEGKLKGQGYRRMFVPRYARKKRFAGEWHEVLSVLFPGYLFVDTDEKNIDQLIQGLSEIPRMTKVLRDGETIAPITKEEQAYLMDMLDEEDVFRVSTGLMIGDEIWITEGPLRDYRGKIQRIDRHRRIADLQINLFGRQTPVQVGLEVVQKVTKEAFEQMKQDAARKGDSFDEPEPAESVERVQVLTGVFEGMKGEILSENPAKEELKVCLSLFGTPTTVTFSVSEVERIESE